MRTYELGCVHGVGHSSGIHGCDGCCGMISLPARESEKQAILDYLNERLEDLLCCKKNDSCGDIAYVVKGIIEDIQDNVRAD